jgi:hypothetical protein
MVEIGQKICCPSSARTEAALAISRKFWERVWAGFAAGVEGGGGISGAKRVRKGA